MKISNLYYFLIDKCPRLFGLAIFFSSWFPWVPLFKWVLPFTFNQPYVLYEIGACLIAVALVLLSAFLFFFGLTLIIAFGPDKGPLFG
jgi:hypothetical protein